MSEDRKTTYHIDAKSIIDIESKLEGMAEDLYVLASNTREIQLTTFCRQIEAELRSLADKYSIFGNRALFFSGNGNNP